MIYIVLDTNILNVSHGKNVCFDSFGLNKNFEEIISSISTESFRDEIRILIPEIVICELKRHRIEAYEKEVEELFRIEKNLSSIVDINLKYKATYEYEKYLDEKVEQFFKKYNLVSFVPTCGDEFFGRIVEKAIKKEAPFEGKDKNSDKGFKDALIFFSLVEYSREHQGEYLYLTKDGKFHGNDEKLLSKQFEEMSGNLFRSFKEYQEVRHEILLYSAEKSVDYLNYSIIEETYILGKSLDEITTILRYSKLKFEASNNVLKRIAYDIKKIYDVDWSEWENFDLKKYDDEEYEEYEGSIDVKVKYNNRGMLSIVFIHYAYRGGIHGGAWYTCKLYDLNTGEQIGLSKLLNKSEEELLQMVEEECNKDKLKRVTESLYFDDFEAKYTTEEDIKFYLDERGVNVYFDEYEAGCYASGMIEFLLVPIKDIYYISMKTNE